MSLASIFHNSPRTLVFYKTDGQDVNELLTAIWVCLERFLICNSESLLNISTLVQHITSWCSLTNTSSYQLLLVSLRSYLQVFPEAYTFLKGFILSSNDDFRLFAFTARFPCGVSVLFRLKISINFLETHWLVLI